MKKPEKRGKAISQTHLKSQVVARAPLRQGECSNKSAEFKCWLPDKSEPEPWLLAWMKESGEVLDTVQNNLIEEIQKRLEEGSTESADLLKLTLDFLGDISCYRARDKIKDLDTAIFIALAANLQRCIGHLEKLSEHGDRKAITLLAQHTLHVSSWLSGMRKKNLKLLKPVARKSIFWPVLKSRCQHFDDIGKTTNDADAAFLKKLEVGQKHSIGGRKIDFTDELGRLVLELIDQIENFRSSCCPFMPIEWQSKALELPPLTRRNGVVDKWATVMEVALLHRFSSYHEMAEKYKHLVSPSKRVSDKRILGELRHVMKGKLSRAVGMECHGKNTLPSLIWSTTSTKNILKQAANSPNLVCI